MFAASKRRIIAILIDYKQCRLLLKRENNTPKVACTSLPYKK